MGKCSMMPGPLALVTEALMEPHLGKVEQDGERGFRNRECGNKRAQEPECTSGSGAQDGESMVSAEVGPGIHS